MKEVTKKIKEKININVFKNIVIAIIAYLATYFVPYIISFKDELAYSNSIIAIAIFALFVLILKKTFVKENVDKLKNVFSLGIIFSAFLVLREQC